jgi:hypothetical protein
MDQGGLLRIKRACDAPNRNEGIAAQLIDYGRRWWGPILRNRNARPNTSRPAPSSPRLSSRVAGLTFAKKNMSKPKLPSAIRLWLAARGFQQAADASFEKLRSPGYVGFISVPVVFLYARSIELSLKACLRQHTADPKVFAKILGHRLDWILAEAERLGICTALGLSKEHRLTIAVIGEDYSDKWYEYPEHFWRARPKTEDLKSAAAFLNEKTQSYVDRKNAKTV